MAYTQSYQPRIIVSGSSIDSVSYQSMIKRVSEAGGTPYLVCDHEAHDVEEDFNGASAVILMGNDFDIDPETYIHRYPDGDVRKCIHPKTNNEKNCPKASARACYENKLIPKVLAAKMPMLCICGGMQRLNVFCGGTLYQYVPEMTGHDKLMQRNHGIEGHVPIIPIIIEPATRLSIIARRIKMSFINQRTPGTPIVVMENSFRNQSIDMVGEGLRVCALSDTVRMPDGTSKYLVEAIEADPGGAYGEQFLIGTQWHPEFCASEIGRALLKELIVHARSYQL